ncbi:hypothetical protein [Muriicola sp. Z0-33]|uniref:hypothetical protein n=1 Tax=Muriicola sp. Z0-33 TaxID=2816957 RepID=UPI00223822F8|nr:hypothetical protein [Muriicola sp. Z0-33]MCW5516835.1 hypothetical protein [Muriicola sp. Z0-33]
MKKIFISIVVLAALVAINGCTNNEGDSDLDIITPVDSTQGKLQTKELPKV